LRRNTNQKLFTPHQNSMRLDYKNNETLRITSNSTHNTQTFRNKRFNSAPLRKSENQESTNLFPKYTKSQNAPDQENNNTNQANYTKIDANYYETDIQ